MRNIEIAELFDRMADTLEIEGANPFRVRAYRNASRVLLDLGREAEEIVRAGEDLTDLPGIGKDLAAAIEEMVRSGSFGALRAAEKRTPASLRELMRVPSVGPKRVAILNRELEVRSLKELRAAAEAHRIRELPGFGARTEARILEELRRLEAAGPARWMLARVEPWVRAVEDYLRESPGIGRVAVAGSYRRGRETVGDLDFVVTSRRGARVLEHFVKFPAVARVVSVGPTRATVLFRGDLQVDVRVVPEASFGAALYYFTGSKSHNIAVRAIALRRGLKINEYGVFKGSRRIAGRTEEEVFKSVGLPYIPPEIRENRGEIEAAGAGRLPRLIALEDIRGDLHSHTDATDGRATLEEMAEAAGRRGYEYLAVTDHTKSLAMTGGLDGRRVAAQGRAIDEYNARIGRHLILLRSSEVDILEDGSLDLPDSVLACLDLAVCSVHTRFRLPRARQTERILRAMRNPYCTILGHPSGRLLGRREAYDVDMEQVLRAAADLGVILEVNSQPERMDLADVYCREGKRAGARFAVSTDAHAPEELAFLRWGVGQARRGWLERSDVVNSWALEDLLAHVGEMRAERMGRAAA